MQFQIFKYCIFFQIRSLARHENDGPVVLQFSQTSIDVDLNGVADPTTTDFAFEDIYGAGQDIDDGQWHHFVVTYESESSTMKSYVDNTHRVSDIELPDGGISD